MVVVMGVVIACSNIALDNAGAITAFLGQANQEIIQNPNSDIDTLYHPSDYESIEQLKENAKNITSKITEEGAVLLKIQIMHFHYQVVQKLIYIVVVL